MPELSEFKSTEAGCLFAIAQIEKETDVKICGSSLLEIYYDRSAKERKKFSYPPNRENLIMELIEAYTSKIVRGSQFRQTPILPRHPGTCPSRDVLT